MSWAAHDLEPYAIQRHVKGHLAFLPLLIGSYAPDLMTKWFVYGIDVFGIELKADDPAQFHRGWPGVGFTHSLAFGALVGLAFLVVFRSRIWALSFTIGHWAHSITDIGDTYGTMLLFPFSTDPVAAGAWAYAGQTGRLTDAGAYFSGLGFVWDGFWLVYVLVNREVLTRAFFRANVVPADGFWVWLGRRLPEEALLAIYRAAFFYGACRWIGWLIWAHLLHDFPFDLSWGGPGWVPAEHS